jgi:hypothetical protein
MSEFSTSFTSLSNLDSESEPSFSSFESDEDLEMTIIDEAKNAIPSTDGTKNLKKFIEMTDKIFGRITAAKMQEFIMIILSKLDGTAYDIASCCEPSEWPIIKIALNNAFLGIKSLTTLHRELSICTQKSNEKIQPYSLRVQSLVKELSKAYKKLDELNCFYDGDENLLSAFEDGLYSKDIKILVKATAVSFSDAVEIAMKEEARNSSNSYREKECCSFCDSETHNVSTCFELKTKNNICYICKNIGHFPSNCRNKNLIQKPLNYGTNNEYNSYNRPRTNQNFSYPNSQNQNRSFDRINYNASNSYDARRRENNNNNGYSNYNNNRNFVHPTYENQNRPNYNNQNNNFGQNRNQRDSGNFRNTNFNSGNSNNPGRLPATVRMSRMN